MLAFSHAHQLLLYHGKLNRKFDTGAPHEDREPGAGTDEKRGRRRHPVPVRVQKSKGPEPEYTCIVLQLVIHKQYSATFQQAITNAYAQYFGP